MQSAERTTIAKQKCSKYPLILNGKLFDPNCTSTLPAYKRFCLSKPMLATPLFQKRILIPRRRVLASAKAFHPNLVYKAHLRLHPLLKKTLKNASSEKTRDWAYLATSEGPYQLACTFALEAAVRASRGATGGGDRHCLEKGCEGLYGALRASKWALGAQWGSQA